MFHVARTPLLIALIATLLLGCASPAPTIIPTVASTATSTPTATPVPIIPPGDSERTLTVDGQERTYLLHVPSSLAGPAPIVFAFHGYDDVPAVFANVTAFNDIADKSSFIVVYPAGLETSWNAGGCCLYAVQKNVNDIAFVRDILLDLGTLGSFDPKRIYAVGFSNGGMFSYRLACEMSDTFAAIASVSGPLFYSPCQPQQPVSIIHVHGLADVTVPYAGGQSDLVASIIFPPTEQGIATWVKLDGCSTFPETEKNKFINHASYTSCKEGTAVEVYTLDGFPHIWPSEYAIKSPSVSEIIWNFFVAHPKP